MSPERSHVHTLPVVFESTLALPDQLTTGNPQCHAHLDHQRQCVRWRDQMNELLFVEFLSQNSASAAGVEGWKTMSCGIFCEFILVIHKILGLK